MFFFLEKKRLLLDPEVIFTFQSQPEVPNQLNGQSMLNGSVAVETARKGMSGE
jgi:hypothetical protein